jgi:hypothetical protein
LTDRGYSVTVVIKAKDVLEELLIADDMQYIKIEDESGKRAIVFNTFRRVFRLFNIARRARTTHLVGSTVDITIVGKLLGLPSIVFFEDDFEAVPQYARIVGRLATALVCPVACSAGKWESKAIKYNGYHELAYLHRDLFIPDHSAVMNLWSKKNRYAIIRFSNLNAYHDKGKSGITNELARRILDVCLKYVDVWIVSERELPPDLEQYRLRLESSKIHSVLYYACLYVGDSQTMAAEAAVLGTPSIRYNDFVGSLGYLEELEHTYGLTIGIRTNEDARLINEIENRLTQIGPISSSIDRLYREKINTAVFIEDLILSSNWV